MADEIWVDVLPSLDGFGANLVKGTAKAARDAGTKSSKEYSAAFKGGVGGASDGAVKELETAQKRASGLVQKLAGDVSTARQGQKRSAADLLTAEQKLLDTVGKYGEESNQAKAATLRLEASREKATTATDKLDRAEGALKEGQKAHTTVTEQLTAAQKKMTGEVKDAPGIWGKMTGAIKSAGGRLAAFSETAGGTVTKLAGAVGGVALLKEAFSGALEKESFVNKLNAGLAATPEQSRIYGAAAGNLYANAYGESMEDVTKSIDSVVSSMSGMRGASQSEIEKVTGYALNLASAFDVDVSEAAQTAGALMKNGLAKDGTEAFDLITGAMNKLPANLRGEVFPIMNEYSKHFDALGIDGETAMGMITVAAQDGEIGMDKVGDSVKEFTIRATDMSKSTTGVYETLGLNAKEMTNSLLAGGDDAEKAMGMIVHGLQGIKDPGEQAAASLALFGTPLEDLGTNKIPDFLGLIDPMGDAFDDTAGAADKLSGTLNDNTTTSLEGLKRSFMTMLSDGVAPALGPLNDVLKWATATPGVFQAVGVGLMVVAGAWLAVTLAASPWIALGLGIAVAIGGIILVVKNWGKIMDYFKNNWKTSTAEISQAWKDAGAGISKIWTKTIGPVIGFAKKGIETLKGVWSRGTGKINQSFKDAGTGIAKTWDKGVKVTFGFFKDGAGKIRDKFKKDTGSIKTAWKDTSSDIRKKWDTGVKVTFGFFKDAGGKIRDKFKKDTGSIKTAWKDTSSDIRKKWNTGISVTFGLFKAGANGAKNSFGTSMDRIKGLFSGMGKNLKKTFDNVIMPVVGIFKKVFKGDIPGAVKDGTNLVKKWWSKIEGYAKKPISFVINTVLNDGLIKAFNTVAGWIPGVKSIGPLKVKGFYDGGYTGDGAKYQKAGDVHAGEFVIQQESTKKIFRKNPGALEHMNRYGEIPGGGTDFEGYAGGGFVRPVSGGRNTSGFGVARGGYSHAGYDIAVPIGTAVRAALAGVVSRLGTNAVSGRTGKGMLVDHPGNFHTYYGHLSSFVAKLGQRVGAGERIANSGNTGRSTGPHLHFETWRGRTPVNPAQFLAGASIPTSSDGGTPGGGGPSFNPLDAFNGLVSKAKGWIENKFPGGSQMAKTMIGTGTKIINDVKSWASDKLAQAGTAIKDGFTGGNDLKWRGMGKAALEHTGDYSWGNLNALMRRMKQESSFNPNAVNNWDINAKNGNASRGLMQVIPTTFAAHRDRSLGNDIMDPYQNTVAAINYTKSRYSSLKAGWGQKGGYAEGGLVTPAPFLFDEGGMLPVGENMRISNRTQTPERVINAPQWNIIERATDAVVAGSAGGDMTVIIKVEDLKGIKTLEEFIETARRKQRQNV